MTRQMADDEVLRPEVVAWAVTKGERRHLYPGANDPREVHDNGGQHDPLITLASHNAAVAALQAERDALRKENETLKSADWYRAGVEQEQELIRAEQRAERAESALEALRGQVAGLVEKWQAESNALPTLSHKGAGLDRGIKELSELLPLKERMG